ncbi:phosphotransferase family protein [Rhizobium sp. LCM 4573]|uniref:phosphotransferase family protein n=1 Tax=Rhizobium sp. LCM 4573 TaxID=1848291 RepID=UPI0008DA87AA|nr:aminoglycoside phosphotransferase family protein [Rhizobium sp. LCM 4573]OHV83614.1 aminoglycoside resistance protein [Rhizobium sp. LCM 4573]
MTDLDTYRAAIIATFPELAGSTFRLATAGWDSVAVDADNRWIFKFPRHEAGKEGLLREAGLLAVIRPAVSLPVPDLRIHPGPPLFSRHEKLSGEHLVTAEYEALPEAARQKLGQALGRFYAEIHGIDDRQMADAGARPIKPWLSPDEIRAKALPALPEELCALAASTIDAFETLGPDPYGETYGFFDGHGWNMAFDHECQQLNGIYDFADSGFGPLHQEFIYSNLVSSDLTARIIAAYEAETGRQIDRKRVAILSGMHRLSELAELADDPEHAPAMIRSVEFWAETVMGFKSNARPQ